MKNKWYMLGTGILMAILLFVGSFFVQLNGEDVDCYDRYKNKIVGEKCITEHGFNYIWEANLAAIMMGSLITVLFYGFGSLMEIFK